MAKAESPSTAPVRILLAEDSVHDRRFFRRLVKKSSDAYDITECADGESALEALQRDRYDLLVVDLNMPGMDGIELIRRGRERLDETAVIVLTGSTHIDPALQAIRLRVMDYILKEPREVLRDTLVDRLRRAAEQVRLVRENRRLERELRLRLTHLEQIHEQMPEAIFATIGPDRRLTEINEQARELLGLPSGASLAGRPIGELLGGLSPELASTVEDLLIRGEPVRNLHVETGGERSRLMLLNLNRVANGGDAGDGAPWVLSLRDVTPERSGAGVDPEDGFHGIIGRDPSVVRMCELIRRVAPLPASVLVIGPTGSGKELVARAVHRESDRAGRPFLAVNCTALSREILESELFGHVKGAFTSAISSRKGRFREADGGTLLLDEIGDTTESFQTKLLRALDSGEIEPVGQDRPIKVNVRIVCSTNKDLARLVEAGKFREDLYYRINVVRIDVPALRDRPGDIALLADAFRREFNRQFRKSIRFISHEAMRTLARHDWPGNVRELRHVLEHAFVVADGPTITRNDLPPYLQNAAAETPGRSLRAQPDAPEAPTAAPIGEAARLSDALRRAGGNVGEAAAILGIHRTTLWRKLRKHGLGAK